jgi:acyl-CoA reductase-like NAD-dependent aldehyde dehydrogenase
LSSGAVATSRIAGEPAPAAGIASERRNPADLRDVVATVHPATPGQVDAAVRLAQAAQPAWGAVPAPVRGRTVARAAQLARERVEDIAGDLTREEGKTLREARAEVLAGADILEYLAAGGWWAHGEAADGLREASMVWTRRQPLGLVAALTPWNFPFSNPWNQAGSGAGGRQCRGVEARARDATHVAAPRAVPRRRRAAGRAPEHAPR